MDQVIPYLIVGGLIALSAWARFSLFKPRDARELPQRDAVDLSGFGSSSADPSTSEPTEPRAE